MSYISSQGGTVNIDSSVFLKNRPRSGESKVCSLPSCVIITLSLWACFFPATSDTRTSESCLWVKWVRNLKLLFQETGKDLHPHSVPCPFFPRTKKSLPPLHAYLLYRDEGTGPSGTSPSPAFPLLLEGITSQLLEVEGRTRSRVLSSAFSFYATGHAELFLLLFLN